MNPVNFTEKYRWPKWSYEGAMVHVPFLIPDNPTQGLLCKVVIAAGDMLLVENEEREFRGWRNLCEVAVPADSPMAMHGKQCVEILLRSSEKAVESAPVSAVD